MAQIPYHYERLNPKEVLEKISAFSKTMLLRRSIRYFDDTAVDIEVIKSLINVAHHAPSGANKQPWHFCIVSDPDIKKKIRIAAEQEEYENYHGRMSQEWLDDLKPFDTNWEKPFLEIAPHLIVVFKKTYNLDDANQKTKNYYVMESVGIACGFLIAAIHMAGLVTLTHTPSPMNFLQTILGRPENEKPFLLLPVGYPAQDATVPNITKQRLEEVITIY
jgi:nitroreductase